MQNNQWHSPYCMSSKIASQAAKLGQPLAAQIELHLTQPHKEGATKSLWFLEHYPHDFGLQNASGLPNVPVFHYKLLTMRAT